MSLHRFLVHSISLISIVLSTTVFAADDEPFISFDSAQLIQGRSLWLDNCKGCHAYGTAGAPIPMYPGDWASRVSKPKATLYDHAINGFFGPDDTMMPERGGNPNLTDEQVKLAVDYMLSLAQHYIDKQP